MPRRNNWQGGKGPAHYCIASRRRLQHRGLAIARAALREWTPGAGRRGRGGGGGAVEALLREEAAGEGGCRRGISAKLGLSKR